MRRSALVGALLCIFSVNTVAHGDHGSHADHGERPEDWALWHLQEEHHIDNFDAPSFFTLHDFNGDGYWTPEEVHRFYGFDDESLKDTSDDKKKELVNKVFALFDAESTQHISRAAFVELVRGGRRLPDFGLGPGHHGDDEYEYEIHHFEKFHGEDATEEELNHPEDIAHFRKHDQMEDEELRVEKEQQQSIVEANIPLKFRNQQ